MNKLLPLLAFSILLLIPVGIQNAFAISDFTGPYEMQNWVSSGIAGGTTSITPASGPTTSAQFGYDVFLGNPAGGVSFRTATFSTTAPATGTVSFDFQYDFFHAFFAVEADLILFADSSSGTTQVVVLDFFNQQFTGPQSFSGFASIAVEEGFDFGIIVGGSNSDTNSNLDGLVTLTNFEGPSQQLIGGEIIPIEQTSLLLAGLQTSALWLAPVVISAIGIGLVLVRRK